jgi:hypothetical protein
MQFDPTRTDAMQWITSYASIYHRPGVPLFDLLATASVAPIGVCSSHGMPLTTAPIRLSRIYRRRRKLIRHGKLGDQGYLAQQQSRLPSHKYRRLHLNLPGSPEGARSAAEKVYGRG